MQLTLTDQLLHSSLTLTHNSRKKVINRAIIDTGSAHTLISSDTVFALNISFSNSKIIPMYGLGGNSLSIRQQINKVDFCGLTFENIDLDFGDLTDYDLGAIIGLDILLKGPFALDLGTLTLNSY